MLSFADVIIRSLLLLGGSILICIVALAFMNSRLSRSVEKEYSTEDRATAVKSFAVVRGGQRPRNEKARDEKDSFEPTDQHQIHDKLSA